MEVLEFNGTVETVEKASKLSGYPPGYIVKTLLLRVGDKYVVVIARGDRRLDYSKAEKYLGVRPRLASPEEVKAILGVEVGAVTPLSPRVRALRVILDPAIARLEYVVCGGGSLNRLYKVRVLDLVNYLKPEVADIFK